MLNKKFSKVLASMVVISSLLVGCSSTEPKKDDVSSNKVEQNQEVSNTQDSSKKESGNSKVHFIDTGNSDSVLIENNGEFMLIDGGDTDDDAVVNNYLNKAGVKTIKYLLATHPHADHIGALDTVVKNFDIENVFIGNGTATTKVYTQFMDNVKSKGYEAVKPNENTEYKLGDGIVKFYNTKGHDGSDLNNESVLVLYSNGNDDFFFTGDAETEVELKYANLVGDVDVYKASHHGSKTGSSQELLNTIKPENVLLLTGKNSYGHPHKEVVNRLESSKITVYRSDESGHIVATSTGNGITFDATPDSYVSGTSKGNSQSSNNKVDNGNTNNKVETPQENNTASNSSTYYFTPSGKSYHTTKDCSALSKSKTILNGTLEEAISKGKDDPCDRCN